MAKKQLRKQSKKQNDKQLLELIARAAEDKQAVDIKILDISKTSKLVDYLVICSVESDAQLRALEKDAADRYQTVAEMILDLQRLPSILKLTPKSTRLSCSIDNPVSTDKSEGVGEVSQHNGSRTEYSLADCKYVNWQIEEIKDLRIELHQLSEKQATMVSEMSKQISFRKELEEGKAAQGLDASSRNEVAKLADIISPDNAWQLSLKPIALAPNSSVFMKAYAPRPIEIELASTEV